jgi:hypothetical protein
MATVQRHIIFQKSVGLFKMSQSCPEKVYVELKIPSDIHSVESVIFRTVSHDQGPVSTALS